MNQKIGLLIASLLLLFGTLWYFSSTKKVSEKPQVAVSFYPYGEFVRMIADDKVNILVLTPPGVDIHDFEPKTGDLAQIYRSKLLIFNGANLEPWVEKILPDLRKTNVEILNASEGFELINESDLPNPHIWLDPVIVNKILENIAKDLVKIDPQNSNSYLKNLAIAQEKISNLNIELSKLSLCQENKIVSSHLALSYLDRRYGFSTIAIQGMSPDDEPSPNQLASLVKEIRQLKIKYILTEGLVNSKYAETIQNEIPGITLLPFYTIEGLLPVQKDKGDNYMSIQQENINTLRKALGCPPQNTSSK